jgi:hypothetical protein
VLSCNVLPRSIGDALGLVWQDAEILGSVGGAWKFQARAARLRTLIGGWAPVELGFAWSENDHPPLILGQVNFFQHFDICFHRSKLRFSLRLHGRG